MVMTMTLSALAQQNRPPWVHRRFLRDTKFRVQERYWRPLEKFEENEVALCIIPSGVVWRQYLKLMWRIIDQESSLQWILLESAAELLDWRNSTPCIMTEAGEYIKEASALQERNKMKQLVEQHPKNVSTLCDLSIREEGFDEWQVLNYPDMTVENRSKHALFRAGRLVGGDGASNIVLLVDNNENHENETDDLRVVCMDEFLSLFGERYPGAGMEELLALKSACEATYRRRNAPKVADYVENAEMTEEQVQQGLRSGTLARGRLEVTKANPKEAYVASGKERYFINLVSDNFARALHHDMVVIKPLSESQWGRPVGRRRLVYNRTEDDEETEVESEGPVVPSARVVSVMDTSRRQFVATMVDEPTGDERAILVIPFDIRIPKIRLQSRGWPAYVNQRLLVEIDGWEVGSSYPAGHLVKIMGPIGDLETEIACLLYEHEIQLEPFSAKALACLPPKGSEWTISNSEIEQRRDLRSSHRIFSVDPPGCQDIDDTMHARVLPNGDIEVGVHIADVTHFVKHESALDKEAQVRGTTFYLVDRRFDMLPSLLSSDLCSLHGKTDRLAVSVIWVFSANLETIKSYWYGRTVIHNCQAMTYEQAHNILNDKAPDNPSLPPPPPLTAGSPVDPSLIGPLKEDLSILQRLARKLRKDRETVGGAVDLSSGDLGTELKFSLDENGNPTKVMPKKELEIHHTIAEMMILANQSVAEKIYNTFPESSLLRIHRKVNDDQFDELESALKAGGIAFDGSSNMALAESLEKAKRTAKGNNVVNALWQSLATRAMSEALYISTGLKEEGVGLSHYGLGIDKYTHFTSPIRRYADVVVHKQLLAALAIDKLDTAVKQQTTSDLRLHLEQVPDSSAISILKGDGISGIKRPSEKTSLEEDDGFLDSLIEGASELVLGDSGSDQVGNLNSEQQSKVISSAKELAPYTGSQVGRICDGLNRQNRMAKLSSLECQRLFLSLYFNDHFEVAHAVVTGLRANGLILYVPKFDLKGPLYLSDINGDVQIDPIFVGLSPDAGLPSTLGFTNSTNCRRFPSGRCILKESNDGDSLEVMVPEGQKKCVFRALDVVSVQISCDLSDIRARVPSPRFHLVSSNMQIVGTTNVTTTVQPRKVTSKMIRGDEKETKVQSQISGVSTSNVRVNSMYEQLVSIEIIPVLSDTSLQRHASSVRLELSVDSAMPGRMVFGGFQNPDTRSATQEAAITAASEAATQRREAALASQQRRDQYDTSRAIERDATARMQRLAAQKRSARRAKGK